MSALKKLSLKAAYLVRRGKGQAPHAPDDILSPASSTLDVVDESDPTPQTVVKHSRPGKGPKDESTAAIRPPLRVDTPAQIPTTVTEPGSILSYIKSTYSDGSSLADLSSISSASNSNEGQLRRENNNCAMYRVDSDWVTMISEPSEERSEPMTTTRPCHSTTSPTLCARPKGRPPTDIFRHRAGPSGAEDVQSNFFVRERGDVTQTPQARSSGAERNARARDPTPQAAIASDGRRWSDFSDAEINDDTRRHIVQVQPGKWELVSEGSRHSVSHSFTSERTRPWSDRLQARYERHDADHFLPELSSNGQVASQSGAMRPGIEIEAEGSETSSAAYRQPIYYLAGSQEGMLYRSDPVRNPLWGAQNAYPSMHNLYAAVGQVATDFHAARLELQAMHHQTMTDAQKVESLRAQLCQSRLKIKEQNDEIENLRVLTSPRSGNNHNLDHVEKGRNLQEREHDSGLGRLPSSNPAASVIVSSPLPDPFTGAVADLAKTPWPIDAAGRHTQLRTATATPKGLPDFPPEMYSEAHGPSEVASTPTQDDAQHEERPPDDVAG